MKDRLNHEIDILSPQQLRGFVHMLIYEARGLDEYDYLYMEQCALETLLAYRETLHCAMNENENRPNRQIVLPRSIF